MSFQERMSNSAYQRAMDDMRKSGLNPILAYKTGGASTPSGASYSPPNSGLATMQGSEGAANIALKSAQAENAREQINNLQANSAFQRQQTSQSRQQERRLKLENDAYQTLSPQMRAMVLSGTSAGSIASAGLSLGKALKGPVSGAFSKIKSFFGR